MSEDDGTAAGGARLPLLLEAVLEIGTELDLPATLQHIVTRAAALTGSRYGALGVLDLGGGPDRPRLSDLYTTGLPAAARARIGGLPDGHSGLIGALIDDPRPLRIDDLTTDPRARGLPPGHPPMRSFLGVPIHAADEVFGNLYLTGKRGGPFTEEDAQLLRVLASQAGIAIGNARLYGAARLRERWIEGAAAVTTALLTAGSATDALVTVAERARLLADAAAGAILQPTRAGGMEIVAASAPHAAGELLGATIPPGSAILDQLLGGEPVFIEDSATDPRMATPVRSRFGPSMMLPLQSGGQLIGTLALPRAHGGRPYNAVERTMAARFASHAALALVLADAQTRRERLAVYEDRDRIARDLHDLVVQRLFATGLMLESTHRRAEKAADGDAPGDAAPPDAGATTPTGRGAHDTTGAGAANAGAGAANAGAGAANAGAGAANAGADTTGAGAGDAGARAAGAKAGAARTVRDCLAFAVDELESTIQEVRTAIIALQQPPADAPTTLRGRVLRETAAAGAVLGFPPSLRFLGPVDTLVDDPVAGQLLLALRRALSAAAHRTGVTRVAVAVDVTTFLADGRPCVRLTVRDDGTEVDGGSGPRGDGTALVWRSPIGPARGEPAPGP
ncbi:GAF domain-containing protein [Streptomyces uncialis]|uniref:GAF domain-containing protein n=1 Tax=Streptomyces uncialis TaxID=1048205 RepID=UPI00383070D9